jgi:hypothetical protein
MLMVAGVVALLRLANSHFWPVKPVPWGTTETLIGVEVVLPTLTEGRAKAVPTGPDPLMATSDRVKSGSVPV